MRHDEFVIGEEFWCDDKQWRCTDIGTRTIVAIKLDAPDASWYHHNAVAEYVFDENDIEGCERKEGTNE